MRSTLLARDKLLKQPQAGPVRRASSASRERAIEMAQRAEVSVYTISTSLTRSGGRGQKTWNTLPKQPVGDRMCPPRSLE